MTTIRLADLEIDALAIMDGARDFASRVEFKALFPQNDADFISAIGKIVSLDGMEILVAEHEGEIVAGIGLLYAPFPWNPDILVADELFWWAKENAPFRAAKVLFDESMKRINKRGAIPVFKALETSPKGVTKMYRKSDMVPIETTFMRFV